MDWLIVYARFFYSKDNTNQFCSSWRKIYNKNNTPFAPVIDGCSDKNTIADTFRRVFESNCEANNQEKVDNLNSRFSDMYNKLNESHQEKCNCSQYKVTVEMVIDATCSMKNGKCSDDEKIHAEHFQNAPLSFLVRMTKLIQGMLNHGFVPSQFRFGHMHLDLGAEKNPRWI